MSSDHISVTFGDEQPDGDAPALCELSIVDVSTPDVIHRIRVKLREVAGDDARDEER